MLKSTCSNIYTKNKLLNQPFVLNFDCVNDNGVLVKESISVGILEFENTLIFDTYINKLLDGNKQYKHENIPKLMRIEILKECHKRNDNWVY